MPTALRQAVLVCNPPTCPRTKLPTPSGRLPSPPAGKLDHFLSGRATPVASPAKASLRPVEHGTIAALTAAKLQL